MSIHTLLLYIIASVILFFILHQLEQKKKDNFLDYIIISNIYILFLSGLFTTYHITENNDNIFLIILFQVLIDIFYTTVILEQPTLKENHDCLKKYSLTLLSSYLINISFINQIDNVLLTPEEFKILLWLFIAIYFYQMFQKRVKLSPPPKKRKVFYQNQEYIVMHYAKFKNQYGSLVHSKYPELNPLIYAIMIYENYYRPEFFRKLDTLKYQLFHQKGKYGIMQISSSSPITDEKSIEIAIKRLEKNYYLLSKNQKSKTSFFIPNIISRYYRKSVKPIYFIYQKIIYFIKN